MSTPSFGTVRRPALAVLFMLWFAIPLFSQSGPTTVRRDVHHDVSLPLSEMIKNSPPPSLARRTIEPLKRIPLPVGLDRKSVV